MHPSTDPTSCGLRPWIRLVRRLAAASARSLKSGCKFDHFRRTLRNYWRAYVNPLGVEPAPCTYCGFCEKYGCGNYSKASHRLAAVRSVDEGRAGGPAEKKSPALRDGAWELR